MSQGKLRDFEFLGKLGSGSFGTVFKVRRKVDAKHYVIKKINISELSRKEQMGAIKEVKLLARLKSRFVTSYFESFIEGSLYIVMEYCDRGDLNNLIKKQGTRRLSETRIWKLFLQIAAGIHYLHEQRVLHRDLKPANIFLCKGEIVKIGDLGVARLLNSTGSFAQTLVGTPFYLSPEMWSKEDTSEEGGKVFSYDDKSDVWALGCILYECCTLKRPFEAQNLGALMCKVMNSGYEKLPPEYSNSLSELVKLMLKKDKNQRISSTGILKLPSVRVRLVEVFHEMDEAHNIPLICRGKQQQSPSTTTNSRNDFFASTRGERGSNIDPSDRYGQEKKGNFRSSSKLQSPQPDGSAQRTRSVRSNRVRDKRQQSVLSSNAGKASIEAHQVARERDREQEILRERKQRELEDQQQREKDKQAAKEKKNRLYAEYKEARNENMQSASGGKGSVPGTMKKNSSKRPTVGLLKQITSSDAEDTIITQQRFAGQEAGLEEDGLSENEKTIVFQNRQLTTEADPKSDEMNKDFDVGTNTWNTDAPTFKDGGTNTWNTDVPTFKAGMTTTWSEPNDTINPGDISDAEESFGDDVSVKGDGDDAGQESDLNDEYIGDAEIQEDKHSGLLMEHIDELNDLVEELRLQVLGLVKGEDNLETLCSFFDEKNDKDPADSEEELVALLSKNVKEECLVQQKVLAEVVYMVNKLVYLKSEVRKAELDLQEEGNSGECKVQH